MIFRATRDEAYPENTPGHKDVTARQGYYIKAKSMEEALKIIKEIFPNEKSFTVYPWSK